MKIHLNEMETLRVVCLDKSGEEKEFNLTNYHGKLCDSNDLEEIGEWRE